MKVEDVCTHAVISTSRSSTIEQAADMMRKYHVGALLVMREPPEAREAVGIVTDRDLVLQAVADGLQPQQVLVDEVMTPGLETIAQDRDLRDALERMTALGVRRLAVTRGPDEIVGVLSVDDVVDGLAMELASLARLMKAGMRREVHDYHHGHAI